MRTIPAAIIIALRVSVMAHAQEDRPEDRVQARGLVGGSAFFESQTHKAVGGTVDFRLAAGLRLGPEVIYHIGPGQDRDITSTALVSYDFRRLKRVTPFVTGGVGLLHHMDGRRRIPLRRAEAEVSRLRLPDGFLWPGKFAPAGNRSGEPWWVSGIDFKAIQSMVITR